MQLIWLPMKEEWSLKLAIKSQSFDFSIVFKSNKIELLDPCLFRLCQILPKLEMCIISKSLYNWIVRLKACHVWKLLELIGICAQYRSLNWPHLKIDFPRYFYRKLTTIVGKPQNKKVNSEHIVFFGEMRYMTYLTFFCQKNRLKECNIVKCFWTNNPGWKDMK